MVRVGLSRLDDKISVNNSYRISKTLIHPSYNAFYGNAVKDVGLIKLAEQIEFIDRKVEPACLDLNQSYTEALGVEAFMVTAWDNAFDLSEHTNELGFQNFAGVRGCVEGFVECQNYIFATALFGSLFGEKGNVLIKDLLSRLTLQTHLFSLFRRSNSILQPIGR